jgi:hypothetical protein
LASKREVPDGWLTVRFDQMADCISERVDHPAEAGVEHYVGLEHLDPESLKIRRWGEPTDVSATKLLFQPGDVIFGRRRAYQRKLAVAEFEGICSAHALVLRAREDVVEKDFLPLFMQSEVFFERALGISVGSLSPTINWKTLAKQEFAIPLKAEQRRIAEVLWAADQAAEASSFAVEAFAAVRQSVIDRAFHVVPGQPLTTPEWPPDWPVHPLGKLLVEGRPMSYGILQPGAPDPEGVPMLRTLDFDEDGARVDTEVVRVAEKVEQTSRSTRLHGHELLISVMGTIGRTFVVPTEMKGWNVNRALAVAPFACRESAEYVQAYLATSHVRATFERDKIGSAQARLDEVLPPEASAVVMSITQGDPEDWKRRFGLTREEEEKLLDRFRDPTDPLQILIVTSKLLTGFDAPILQAMYLDKPMKDHNLLQAICRTNRPYPSKIHGLIVDYLGIFDDVAKSLDFDEKSVQQVISNLEELKRALPGATRECLDYFESVDRTVGGYEGLIAAQECLPDDETRDAFAASYSVLSRLWEALSPDPVLQPYRDDYRWLSQVYESVQPPSGNGKLLWHALGAKTIELIHQNVHVEAVRDDLETMVMDADVLEELAASKDPSKTKEIEIKIIKRLRKHLGNPLFVRLGERLEALRQRHEQGLISSMEFLKQLLELAREVVQAEKETEPEVEEDRGKAALTELFQEVRNESTPVMVERIVNDIDEIVRVVRFPDWQQTIAGEREVQRALRRTLLKYKLHTEQELFDRAYAYIKQYY